MTAPRRLGPALGAALALAVGCGGDDADSATTPSRSFTAAVRITVDRDGADGAGARTTTLRCPSERTVACRRLRALPRSAFAPVPGDVACAEVYGGPQTGRIRGTVTGRAVDARYSRTDACESARYDRVASVLRVAR